MFLINLSKIKRFGLIANKIKMKILFSSNAPWCPSGYGVQSKLLIDFLQKNNHEIVFLTNFGLMGGYLEHEGVLYFPDEINNWGNTSIDFHVAMQKPDLILSLCDWFVYEHAKWNHLNVPWINWTPIDLNINKNFERLQNFIQNCFGIVPLSKFGQQQLELAGASTMPFIHHAIDSTKFKILDKKASRMKSELPQEPFIIGMVMANKDATENRKAFDYQFEAVKQFIDKHQDLNIMLYLHTEPSEKYNGLNLIEIFKDKKFDLNKVIFTNPMKLSAYSYSFEQMAYLYNSLDVLMNASSGEGFGIPIIEAQACGIPVLTHDATSMTELTFYGYAAKSDKKTKKEIIDYGFRFMPSVSDMVKGLEYILENRNEEKKREVSNFVRENFDIERIGSQWLDILNTL